MSNLRIALILAARDAGDHEFADWLEVQKNVDYNRLQMWAVDYDVTTR